MYLIPNARQLARFSCPVPGPVESTISPNRDLSDLFESLDELNTEENDRIVARLSYALQLVQMRKPRNLSEAQMAKRNEIASLLSLYIQMGLFPTDYGRQSGSQLVVMDDEGRFGALGFLIERTAGRGLAIRLGTAFREDALLVEDHAAIMEWISASGLTQAELSMLQPGFTGTVATEDQGHQAPAALNAVFAGLQQATQARHGDYLASAFVGASSGISSDDSGHNAVPTQTAVQPKVIIQARSGRGEALASIFEMLRPSPAGNLKEQPQQTRAFFIPNTTGEPVIALTFSRSF